MAKADSKGYPNDTSESYGTGWRLVPGVFLVTISE
jgi:hypothetical protein